MRLRLRDGTSFYVIVDDVKKELVLRITSEDMVLSVEFDALKGKFQKMIKRAIKEGILEVVEEEETE